MFNSCDSITSKATMADKSALEPQIPGRAMVAGTTGLEPSLPQSRPTKKVGVLVELTRRGCLLVGDRLEIVPAALPPDFASRDPRAFRATIADPTSQRKSLSWEFDGAQYSATELTCRLWREFGVAPLSTSYWSHWRVVGRELSLWDEWLAVR
jgi:hypothetical protein